MTSPLEGALAAKIGRAFASTFYAATVNRTTTAAGENDYTPGEPTTVAHACKGMVDQYSDFTIANELVDRQDRKVLVLASTLAITPTDGDTVTIRGQTYRIINVKTDPALAVWELQARI